MFDQEISDPIIVYDPPAAPQHFVLDRAEPHGLIQAIVASTGANDATLLEPGHSARVPLGSAPFNAPAFPSLVDTRSWQADIRRFLDSGVQDGRPVWVRRGIEYLLCLPLPSGGRPSTCLILSYSSRLDVAERAEMEARALTILPLVEANMRTTAELADLSRKFAGTMGFLHTSHVAMILFDDQGHMILANDAARSIMDANDGIRMGHAAPVPVSLKDAARFQLALGHQIADNAAGRMGRRRSTVLLIRRQDGQRPFVATLIPVPAAAARPGDPAVMLYLFDPAHDYLDHLSAICELYGLSQVEARLAHHLTTGKTVDEAAAVMRIKSPTARTYLKQIFSKTGTHRQTELVRLLLLSTGRIASQALPEALC